MSQYAQDNLTDSGQTQGLKPPRFAPLIRRGVAANHIGNPFHKGIAAQGERGQIL